ncbi:hypothetical protein HPB49_002754 [Dermacentor silvarum]|uniref:Uncharacterized protein n=1 Tax=Dermacentor silvarum TaxID=543639 RepID=A0ACB8CD40_DERSI|nr:hypothetical protein HPB49_002754 [Dermacentor silvarum]
MAGLERCARGLWASQVLAPLQSGCTVHSCRRRFATLVLRRPRLTGVTSPRALAVRQDRAADAVPPRDSDGSGSMIDSGSAPELIHTSPLGYGRNGKAGANDALPQLIAEVVQLGTAHVSLYELTLERGTQLFKETARAPLTGGELSRNTFETSGSAVGVYDHCTHRWRRERHLNVAACARRILAASTGRRTALVGLAPPRRRIPGRIDRCARSLVVFVCVELGLSHVVVCVTMAANAKKRTTLTFAAKLEAIQRVENGEKKSSVAEAFGIPRSTLSTTALVQQQSGQMWRSSPKLLLSSQIKTLPRWIPQALMMPRSLHQLRS